MRRTHLLPPFLACVALIGVADASTTSWSWSDSSAWTVPGDGDCVVVGSGETVYFDATLAGADTLAGLVIEDGGRVEFDEAQDVVLRTDFLLVEEGGELVVGTPGDPFDAYAAIIELTAEHAGCASYTVDEATLLVDGGKLSLHGASPDPVWTRLAVTASAGDDELVLEDDVSSWPPNGLVAIASTDFDYRQAEVHVIESIATTLSSSDTLVLHDTLDFEHHGETYGQDSGLTIEERAEVALLNRTVQIVSDERAGASGPAGHVEIRRAGVAPTVAISGVLFHELGRFKEMGKYPLHFHMAQDLSGQASSSTASSTATTTGQSPSTACRGSRWIGT